MAITHRHRDSYYTIDYIGLSGDVKPTPYRIGCLFYETDTGLTYIYSGTAWVQLKTPSLASMVLAAGTNNIGDVDIASALPAGSNNIGDVDVLTLPALVAGEAHIGEIGGRKKVVTLDFTRPADTTAYAAKDAIAVSTSSPTVFSFNIARIAAGAGTITKVRLWTDQSTNVAQYRLHFYSVTPTAINDNAAFTILWANRAKRVGFADIGPLSTEGTGSDSANGQNTDVRVPFVCAAASTTLYALVETLTAFTPASEQKFFIAVTAELD